MLLSGMDVSEDNVVGNYKYLSIVIGTQNSILSLFNKIGKAKLHMNTLSKKDQKKIINKLFFDGNERIAFCIRIDRGPTIKKIKNMRKTKKRNIAESKILRTFHYLLFQELKDPIEQFTINHGISFSELVIQCDDDCINIVRDVSLQHVREGISWRISDAVAWCNNRSNDPPGVISLNLAKELEQKLIERLFR